MKKPSMPPAKTATKKTKPAPWLPDNLRPGKKKKLGFDEALPTREKPNRENSATTKLSPKPLPNKKSPNKSPRFAEALKTASAKKSNTDSNVRKKPGFKTPDKKKTLHRASPKIESPTPSSNRYGTRQSSIVRDRTKFAAPELDQAAIRDSWPKHRKTPPPGTGLLDPHAEREAKKYDNPIPSREAILHFLAESEGLMTAEKIADALQLSEATRFDALCKRLGAMVRDGQLLVNRRGGYGVAEKLDLIAGQIIANPDGFGFVRPDAGGDDVFLSPQQMKQVLHGDRVLINIVGLDRRGRREGAIAEVLERRPSRIVGRYLDQDGMGIVVPDDKRIHRDVMIPFGRERHAKHGQIVVAEITTPPSTERPPVGRVVSVLGDKLSASLTVQMAIESHGLPQSWPDGVQVQMQKVEPEVLPAEIKNRIDLRTTVLVTIDGEDAKDFDDAVYCEPNEKGFRLIVAIADVSHYVRVGNVIDDEARARSTSVYFPGFVVPMLPEVLSNGICSLMPKVDRLCMVCEMQVNRDGEVEKSKFYEAVMHSHARLTYTQVWQAVGEKNSEVRETIKAVLPQVEQLHQLYKAMAKARAKRGAIEFESSEVKFRLGAAGEVLSMGAMERNDAHKLIEECMIAANVEAAKFLLKKKLPAPYRVHAPPPDEKYADLLEFLREFQLQMPPIGTAKPIDFANMLKRIRERPDAGLIESVVLRSQSLAVYQPDCIGHFGLALDAYAHFTSPIRRYPDLLVHRAIRHALQGGSTEQYVYSDNDMIAIAANCSALERRATEAERDVDDRYKCAFMEKHVGSQFTGTVSGVASFGLFVELDETRINGMVHITQLPNDYWHFDPKRRLLTGERRGMKFRLGDRLKVLVLRASLEDRKIDFRLVQAGDDNAEQVIQHANRKKPKRRR